MPDRPGLDDKPRLQLLIDVWRDGQADLDSRLTAVYDQIRRELSSQVVNRNTVYRLRRQADRLDDLAGDAAAIVDDLARQTRSWIDDGGMLDIYAAGAQVTSQATGQPWRYTIPHQQAVEVLSQDLYDDVLEATRFVDDDAKTWVRRIGRQLTGFKLTSGEPVKAQARRFERELRREFGRRGIGSVTYRDGSRHGFGEYAEMLLRTKTGVAYNAATTNTARALGIQYFELLDGANCGLIAHHDPQLANGLIVDLQTAIGYPLSHPNCRRAVNPRPDLNQANVRDAVSVQSPEARADQAAFEEALRRQQQTRAGRRQRRERRTRRPRRQPRAAAPAPAAQAGTVTSRHKGGGWYDLRDESGRVIQTVRGKAAAERRLIELGGGQQTTGELRLTGGPGGWYQLRRGETVIERVRGKAAAERRLAELGGTAGTGGGGVIELTGGRGGWYQLRRDGQVVERVRGRAAAERRVAELGGGGGAVAPPRRGPVSLGRLDAGDPAADWVGAVGARNQIVDVASGPIGKSISGTPGHGVALVDDVGRLFYVEATPEVGQFVTISRQEARQHTLDRLEALRRGVTQSTPDGMRGARAHVSVLGRSTDDAYWAQRYGDPGFRSSANATADRVIHFGGRVDESSVWHESGHSVAGEANRLLAGRHRAADYVGRGRSDPGGAWRDAQARDRAHLQRVEAAGELDGWVQRDRGTRIKPGWGQFGSQPPTFGVTDYGSANVAEDFAESWRLFVETREAGYLGEAIDSTGRTRQLGFGDLFPNRARYLDRLARELGVDFSRMR